MMTGTTVNRPRTLASPDWAIARATDPRPEVADQVPRRSPQPAGVISAEVEIAVPKPSITLIRATA